MTKNYLHYLPPRVERGAATLVVAIVLLLALTLMTFSAARIGVTEQRASANDVRAKDALAAAQAGIEQGIAYLAANKFEINSEQPGGWMADPTRPCWVRCTATDTAIPCMSRTGWMKYNTAVCPLTGIGSVSPQYSIALDFLAQWNEPTDKPPNNSIIYITARAIPAGDPLAGAATVSQIVKGYSAAIRPPSAPLMVNGTVDLSGSINIWGNSMPPGFTSPGVPPTTDFYNSAPSPPHDYLGVYPPPPINANLGGGVWLDPNYMGQILAGTGLPLSVWASGLVTVGGSASTCIPTLPATNSPTPRLSATGAGGGSCSGAPLIPLGLDIVSSIPSPTFGATPPDFPADLFFYIWGETPARLRSQAVVLADCSSLHSERSGLYWVDGDCTISGSVGNVGGGPTTPTGPIFLIVDGDFSLSGSIHYWGMIYVRGTGTVSLTGSPVLHGALVSESSVSISAGSPSLVYDRRALELDRFANGSGGFAKVPGGWFDRPQ